MAGNHSRDKGARGERMITKTMQAYGFAATKISRMYGPNRDVLMPFLGVDRHVECKWRKKFTTLKKWKGDNFLLVLKADGERPWALIDLEDLLSYGILLERLMKPRPVLIRILDRIMGR